MLERLILVESGDSESAEVTHRARRSGPNPEPSPQPQPYARSLARALTRP